MNNNRKEDMVFVSFERLWANFKRFWWIAVGLALVMIIYGAATYNRTLQMSDLTEIDKTVVEVPLEVSERVYVGKTSINYQASLADYFKITGINSDTVLEDADMYNKVCMNIFEYAKSILSTERFLDKVNSEITKLGYQELITSPRFVGDRKYDIFQVEYVNDRMLKLNCSGVNGKERVEAITNIAAKEFVSELNEICGYVKCEPAVGADIFFRINIYGYETDFAPTEESVMELYNQYLEHNKIATGELEKYSFSVSALFKMSTVIKGAVGFVIGLFIIFVIAMCDKKVRTREELERFFDGDAQFLGEYNKKNAVSEDITAVSVAARCNKMSLEDVIITTPGRQKDSDSVKRFSEKVSENNICAKFMDGIEVNTETVKKIASSQGAVLVISSGLDEVEVIKSALSRINTVEGNIIGYVICK